MSGCENTSLCASCGKEIEDDSLGLCVECEDNIQRADLSGCKKNVHESHG